MECTEDKFLFEVRESLIRTIVSLNLVLTNADELIGVSSMQ